MAFYRLNMKFLFIIACSFVTMGCQNVTDSGTRFAMYLVQKPSALLENIELAPTPVLTDADIVSYNWEEHRIVLTDEGIRKLPTSRDIGDEGKPFVVVADGKRCYLGAFWTTFSSLTYSNPVINVLKAENKSITIQRAYPSSQFGKGDDPRPDKRLLKVLTELKKLN